MFTVETSASDTLGFSSLKKAPAVCPVIMYLMYS